MKKIIASVLCFTMCAAMFAGCSSSDETTTAGTTGGNGGESSSSEAEKTDPTTSEVEIGSGDIAINVYAMSDEVPNMITEFFNRNPDLAAKYTINATVSNNDNNAYETKLNAALTAGGDLAPDLYVAEADYILPYTQGEFAQFAAPYSDFIDDVDGKLTAADIAKYTVELGTNTDGKLVALCYQCTGGAFIYRRSIAKEVFGSDDQATVEAAIGAGTQSWDKFFEAAEALKAKGYAIVSGLGDVWNVCEKAASTPWVVDGKLNIDPMREEYLDIAKKLIDGDYTNKTDAWQEAWYADMKDQSERKVFGWYGPAWLINYVIAKQAVDEATGFGDYAVCVPNVGFWWGGSWLLANKDAIANPDKKEIISKIVEWITLDCTQDGLLYAWANGTIAAAKDTVSSGTVMKMSDGSMDFLGGQNPFDIFVQATSYASAKCKCEYDSALNGVWQEQVKQYAMGEKSKEDALNEFKDVAANAGIEI
jgi:hypothetical protein